MGYQFDPVVRMVPRNGVEETLRLADEFSDLGGAKKTTVAHEPITEEHEDINRALSLTRFGFRPTCSLTFEIFDTYDHEQLALIVNRLMSPEWAVYLSLDSGETEREVILDRYRGPRAIAGKTFVGGTYELGLQAKELIDEVPPLGGGVW